MFGEALKFNQNISNWNVSSVNDMSFMFYVAHKFNQDISNWDVSNVTNMNYMFYGAWDFNKNLCAWDISKVGTNNEKVFEYTNQINNPGYEQFNFPDEFNPFKCNK